MSQDRCWGHYLCMSPEHQSLTDTQLLRASRRDLGAFEALFERHASSMRGWFENSVGDVPVANDLLAETFAQAWRSRRRFAGEHPAAGTAWLYGIARNLLRQHYRQGRVRTAARERLGMSLDVRYEDELDAVVERLDATGLRSRLDAAMDALPAAQRLAVGGRVVREVAYADLASELGCSAQSARAHVSRGLRTLNAMLKREQW